MKTNATTARGRHLWRVPLALFFLISVLAVLPLAAEGPAYLQAHQILYPLEIYAAGTGIPDTTTLDLIIEGVGPAERFPVDAVLVVDRSATADLAASQRVAFDLIGAFLPQDRIAIVSYATTARFDAPLRSDQARLKAVIADLEKGGRSALGDAMQLARQELLQNGRDYAILAIILLTDGQHNIGREPAPEGEVAREAGIKIIPIGIGHLINRSLLERFAAKTGGRFFPRPIATIAEKIVDLLTVTVVARDVRVEKVLPAAIGYVEATPAPTRVLVNLDGTTSLIWRLGEFVLGEQWRTAIILTAKAEGEWPTGQGSTIEYSDFRGVSRTILLPARTITAIVPPPPPPPPVPPIRPDAAFEYIPEHPSTVDMVKFTDLSTDEDGEVVAWAWEFGDGATSDEQNPQHRFARSGIYIVTLVVTDNDGYTSERTELAVKVANEPPVAMFGVAPDRPRVAVETIFDASKSYDMDGRVVSYAWDFDGDGLFDLTTASPKVTHTFLKAGEVVVLLKVADDEGGVGTVERSVEVLPSVSVVRTIETGLPQDKTIAEGLVTVTVTITVNTEIHGLTLREEIPEGWAFAEIDHSSATFHADTITWLFLETLLDGDRRVIQYTLTAPDTPPTEALTESLTGLVQSSFPRLSRMVLEDDRVVLTPALSIPVVISRWDTGLGKIDLFLPEQIAFDQIQYAVSLWLTGDAVPHTGELVITLDLIRDLIAYWLTGRSVHDPLP